MPKNKRGWNPDPDAMAKLENPANRQEEAPEVDPFAAPFVDESEMQQADEVISLVRETSAEPDKTFIRVLRDYGGRRTKEKRIAPGVYAADDLLQYGADFPEYLVSAGVAEWVKVQG